MAGVKYATPGTPTFVVQLGEGNDIARSINSEAAGKHVAFYGEGGDDDIESDASSDLLDGGPGNDQLEPDGEYTGSRGDIVRGGDGRDKLQLVRATGNPVVATLNGVADDGAAGQGDNYGADLEDIQGADGASMIFAGNDAPNTIFIRADTPTSSARWAATTTSTRATATTRSTAGPATTCSSAAPATTSSPAAPASTRSRATAIRARSRRSCPATTASTRATERRSR